MAEKVTSLPPYQEFLSSDTFTLRATNSDTPFKIHEALLRSTSPVLAKMCEGEFREGRERTIHFKEHVLESTLIAFIQWAYTKDYPNQPLDISNPTASGVTNSHARTEVRENSITEELVHPLLWHILLYDFGHRYFVPSLQALAKRKITTQLQAIQNLREGHEREAVLDLLEYAFGNLADSDPILPWLAMVASWKLEELKQCNIRFDELLSGSGGAFARHLVRFVVASPQPPWSPHAVKTSTTYPNNRPSTRGWKQASVLEDSEGSTSYSLD
ncbi:hypothetical protein FGG08_007390 [Glutinoglossum americanum]|uniref:BTB domain-containing protein n=1 Tax=Glutinoglossum americanum TaxID=1670608 RepID=A0A9P8HYY5_9PEZI|nr:hypothetical protein FGG08_007390 [Glutinoglossum americanum]